MKKAGFLIVKSLLKNLFSEPIEANQEFSTKSNKPIHDPLAPSVNKFGDYLADDKFTKQFSLDIEKEKVVINNVEYFDEDEDEYFDAELIMFGHSWTVTTLRNGEPLKILRSTHDASSDIQYDVLAVDNNRIVVQFESDKIKLLSRDYYTLKCYINKMNEKFVKLEEEFNDEVKLLTSSLLKNVDLVQIATNFINGVNPYILLNPDMIFCIECIIVDSSENTYGESCLLSDELQRSNYSRVETTQIDLHSYMETKVVDNSDVIEAEFMQGYRHISQFIQTQFTEDLDNLANLVAYSVIWECAKREYSQSWLAEYGIHFTQIDILNIQESIETFLRINDIDTNDIFTVGKFICFLIQNNKFETTNYINCFSIYLSIADPILEKQRSDEYICSLRNKSKE